MRRQARYAQADAQQLATVVLQRIRQGGYTYSLGMPSLYQPYTGFELQSYSTGEQGDLGGLLNLGIDKNLGNPIVGAAGCGLGKVPRLGLPPSFSRKVRRSGR